MALINCPECGKEISDKAGNCPNCGCPIQPEQEAAKDNRGERWSSEQSSKTVTKKNQDKPKKKGGCLKVLLVIVAVIVVIGIIGSLGGGDDNESGNSEVSNEEKVYLKDEEIPQLFTDPDQFEGKYVKLTGKIFTEPEDAGDYIGLQVWNNPENAENNFLVTAPKDGTEYSVDSYVVVDGRVDGSFTGENLVGGVVTAPMIEADTVTISNYKDVMRPTIKEISFDSLQEEQYGYSVSITKVEFAEQETRVYATVKNDGESKLSIWGYSAKLIQNGQQYEAEMNYDADYPELQSEILSGTESSGVIVFPAIDPNTDCEVYIEGYSDNYEEDIEPYQFDVTAQN